MTTLVTDHGTATTNFPTQTVEIKSVLGAPGGWTLVPHLYCDRLALHCNAYDEAMLSYEIGEGVQQPGATSFSDYQPLALKGKFVRITVAMAPADLVWYGYFHTDVVARDAVKNVGGVNKLAGQKQTIGAVGLEYFLDRKQIDSAVVRATGETPNYRRIQRNLTFNGGVTTHGDTTIANRGNRSQGLGGAGVYDFTDSFDGAPLFSAQQTIEHLLEYHTMLNSFGNKAPCAYALHGTDAADFLAGYYPTLPTKGITVFAALNKICSATRGLVWWSEYDPTLNICKVRVQSGAPSAVSLPGGGTLAANTKQFSLDIDSELDVQSVRFSTLGSRDFDQVVTRGARMTSTCTVGLTDGTAIGDWSLLTGPTDPGTEKKYKEAAKNDADYAGLSSDQKATRNDSFRRNDAFYRVYSCFRIPSSWDGKTGDGATGQRNYALPIISDNGSVIGSLGIHTAGLRMLNTLRLKRGWNYTDTSNPKSATPTGTLAELAPPFAIIKVANYPERYQYVDKLRNFDYAVGEKVSDKITTSYHLHMQTGVPGFRVTASGGMQHAIASAAWAGAEPSATSAELDYGTLRATVCLEADAFCEAKWPEAGLPNDKPLEILQLELGEHYRLDFVAANTVVGLENGVPQLANNAKALRDDRKFLRDVARLAYEWYQIDRNSLELTLRQLRNTFQLGQLITTIGTGATEKNVNTCVSSLTYELGTGGGTTKVKTADHTLDIRSLVG